MGAPSDDLPTIRALRSRLWENGFRPVPVYGIHGQGEGRGKRPSGMGWQDAARANPPACLRLPVSPAATNTGILCDGWRAVDIDIDDHEIASQVEAIFCDLIGATLVRWRGNSGKRLMLYRASEGEPPKIILNGAAGKIEVLGRGQQFVAYGLHPSGATLEWRGGEPLETSAADLRAVGEDEIRACLDACRTLIGAVEEITEKPSERKNIVPFQPAKEITGREQAAFAKALDDEAAAVRGTGQGGRNNRLNTACFNLGQMIASGWGSRDEAEHAMRSVALACGLKPREIELTMRSGFAGGMKNPRPPLQDRRDNLPVFDPSPLLVGREVVDQETGEIFEADDDERAPDALDEDLTRVGGILGQIIEAMVESARRPNRRLALAAALPLVGTLIGRRISTPTRSGTHLYVIATAGTAVGKQHYLDCIERIMGAANLARHVGPSQFMSMSALNKHIESAPLSICGQDEFGAVLRKISHPRASGHEIGISMVLRMLWGASFSVVRTPAYATARSIEVRAPSMSLFAPTTPEELYDGLKGKDMVNGFLNRFLVIDGGFRTAEVEPTIDLRRVAERLAPNVMDLYRIGVPRRGNMAPHVDKNGDADPEPLVVQWANQAAQDDYHALSNECLRRIDADVEQGALFGRTAEIAIRLATIRACGDDPHAPMVTSDHIAWAARLAFQSAELATHAADKHMVDPLGAAEFERKVLAKLRGANGRMMTMREIYLSMSKNQRFAGDLEKTLKALAVAGLVEVGKREAGSGRPGLVVRAM